ncbi:MAG: hypothetical protein J2P18_04955 [Nocardia sp.]|nr:hypothetical protein [Nocardia sp.]
MFRVAALIPSPPVLVPELCGGHPDADPDHPAAELPALRSAVVEAGRILGREANRWTIVGAGPDSHYRGAGTFAGFGADIRVGLSAGELDAATAADPGWPCPLLIGAWLRGRIDAESAADGGIHARARLLAAGTGAAECAEFGAGLRAELDADPDPQAVLIVADGAATLSTRSPGYLDPRAEPEQRRIDHALDTGDRAVLAGLDARLCAELEVSGRPCYQVLAGLFGVEAADPKVETRYRAAPFGVGYHVSLWYPAEP